MTSSESLLVEACAHAAHEANRAYCRAIGDNSQAEWDTAPEWVRDSARAGVRFALAGKSPAEQHDAWCAHKIADGWVHGPTKDAAAKTHPCLVPYAELPEAQRRKDALYQAAVRAMSSTLAQEPGGVA